MRTFEERYTAWIDGELEGNALVAFEQELERRAAVGEAYADKTEAMHLSGLLHGHLQAPTLTNGDFFNHQLRERIAGERAATQRPLASRLERAPVPLFVWSLSRLAGLGAACLFISGALYYGMIPKQGSPGVGAAQFAHNTPEANTGTQATGPRTGIAQNSGSSEPAAGQGATGPDHVEVAALTKEQQERLQREQDLAYQQEKIQRERATIEPGSDIQARVPDLTLPTTATPLHYKDSNVNVLWVNGLDYLPDASALDNAANSPAPAAPAPAATAIP